MWMETLPDGRFKYIERYKDPYTEKYKRKSVILTSDSRQAQKKAQKLLDEKINASGQSKQSAITLRQLHEEWFSHAEKRMQPATRHSYNAQTKIIFEYLDGDIKIQNIDTKLLQNFFDNLNYSAGYIKSMKAELNQMLKYARKLDYIADNPMAEVELVHRAKTADDIQKIENKFLEQEEVERLLVDLYSRSSTYRIARLVEFMYLTGVRNGEAVILRPSDFDFESRLVHITGSIVPSAGYKNAVKGPPKTVKGYRDVELTERCIKLVKRSIAENKLQELSHKNYLPGEYIFATNSGTPLQNRSINLSIRAAGQRVGLEHKHLTTHIFRHSHISKLAELGIPISAIMERVGHENETVTNQIYTHITKGMRAQTIGKLAESGM